MAENIKISEMPNLASFDGSEMIPLVHNGENYHAKFTDMKKFMGAVEVVSRPLPPLEKLTN